MFYKTGIDISNPKSMWEFLHNHFTYSTCNSWNSGRSIAHNVKLYNLKLKGDWTTAARFLFDDQDIGDLQILIQEKIEDFVAAHSMFRVYFNGRQGGYLVLYNRDNNYSILPDFITDYDNYEHFKSYVKTCYGQTVKEFTEELRVWTELVRDFDRLCDDLRDLVNEYSKMDYDNFVLAGVIDRFNERYYEDLEYLEFAPLTISTEGVDISSIQQLDCLVEALLRLFGENRDRVEINDFILRIKED